MATSALAVRLPRCGGAARRRRAGRCAPACALPARRELLVGGAALLGTAALPPAQLARAEELPLVPRGAPLGANAITPSAVIKGCWQLSGGHRGDPASDRTSGDAAVADFDAFVRAGIDTFDMGPETCGYGPAESIVGDYLRSRAGKGGARPLVFTKLCCVGGEQASPSGEWVRGRVDRALARLARPPRLDLLQVYWNDYGYSKQLIDMAKFVQEERDAGRVGAVAFTNFDTDHLEALRSAGVEVAAHQIQFSLLDRRPALRQLAWCADSGCKLLPYGVLAGGLLSDRYLGAPQESVRLDTSSKQKYASVLGRVAGKGGWDWFQRLLRTLRTVGDAHGGASVANVAARWVLDHEAVGAIILGARNASNVEEHRRLFALPRLSDADRAAIEEVLADGAQPRADTYQWERGGGVF